MPQKPPELDLTRIQLNGGAALLADSGGDGVPLLLIHGLPGRPQDFRWMVPQLAPLRTILPAMPGLGLTPLSTAPSPASGQRVRFLLDVIEALQLGPVIVGGHSLGGAMAIQVAQALGDRARGLVLISSTGLRPHRGFRRLRPRMTAALLGSPLRPAFTPVMRVAFRSAGFPRNISTEALQHTVRCAAETDFSQVERALSALRIPTLLASASDDPLIEPAIQTTLGEAAPPGPRLCFATGGHGTVKTRAAEISDAIRSWVAQEGLQA